MRSLRKIHGMRFDVELSWYDTWHVTVFPVESRAKYEA